MEASGTEHRVGAVIRAPRAGALVVRHLDRTPFGEALALQNELREARMAGRIPDTVLLLEHPDVITFGCSARPENTRLSDRELEQAGYEVCRTNRGGDVTYHGPGQLIGYPILDLSQRGRDVDVYLRQLEEVLIEILAEFGIPAVRRQGYAGAWLDERRKIASIGVSVRRWVSMHGFALNVSCSLSRFDPITACGLPDAEMTSMSQVLGRPPDMRQVRNSAEAQLRRVFE
jgi:lipoyl(octanoyl) transferase